MDKGGRIINEKDEDVLRDELDWTAHEAEVANLRSEALMRRMLHIEEDVVKIKESIKMSLDVFMEIDRKLGNVEANLIPPEKKKQIRSRKGHGAEIAVSSDLSVERLTDLDRQVLDLLSANGPMSSRDIQVKIGKSREHISRLLGKLVDQELVGRNRLGRRFTYNILNVAERNNHEGKVGP